MGRSRIYNFNQYITFFPDLQEIFTGLGKRTKSGCIFFIAQDVTAVLDFRWFPCYTEWKTDKGVLVMKRFRYMTLCLTLAASMLTGCGGGGNSSAVQTTKAPETAEEFRAAMVSRSLLSVGNTTRIRAVMEQAKAGGEVTLAYIGGSITEGYNAGETGCYARKSYEAFASRYGAGDNVQYVNAGLSGTPSVLGVLRAEEEVYQYAPDVIFIEFAVNDAQDEAHRTAYESLVWDCLSQPQSPAVVLLFTVLDNGYTCQEQMAAIGAHYDLPMISVGDAINPELAAGRMVWSDYASDGSHPHTEGHLLITEFIENYLTAAEQTDPTAESLPREPLSSRADAGAKILSWSDLAVETGSFDQGTSNGRFPLGYTFRADGTTEALAFTVTGTRLYLTFKQCNNKDWGMMGVYVNGHFVDYLAGNDKNGWGGPSTKLVYESKEAVEMHVEIRPLEEQENLKFELLAVALNE